MKADLHVDYATPNRRNDFDRAHLVVLQHLKVVDPWLQKHIRTIKKKYADRGEHKSEDTIIREHNKHFASWFKKRLKKKPLKPSHLNAKLIYALALGPTCTFATYQAYDINGYTFYTEAKDKNSDYQNSGVMMESSDNNGKKQRY